MSARTKARTRRTATRRKQPSKIKRAAIGEARRAPKARRKKRPVKRKATRRVLSTKKKPVLTYEQFRSPVDFGAAAAELRREAQQAYEREGRRYFWGRRQVLGRMMQRKAEAYEGYLRSVRRQKAAYDLDSYRRAMRSRRVAA